MTKLLIPFLLLSLCTFGQTSSQKIEALDKTTDQEWRTLDQSNYSIKYPSSWELDQSGQMGTSFVLFSALQSNHDKFRENVNLLIQDLSGKNIDLNTYTEISEHQIKTMATNADLIESKRIKNDNGEFQKVIYTADQSTFHLKFEQYYFVISEKAYVLTFTSELTEFADFKETAEKILTSFKLKK